MSPSGFVLTQVAVLGVLYLVAVCAAWIARRFVPVPIGAGLRYQHLDGLRAVAAVGVVACHINQYANEVMGLPAPELSNHVGIVAVQMFFALTAFLFTERALRNQLDPARFYVGRVFRILPLYFLAVAAAVLLALHASAGVNQPLAQSINEAVRVVTFGFWQHDAIPFRGVNMLSLIGIAWTLSYEWMFYLLLVPIFHLYRTSSKVAWLVCGAVLLLVAHSYSLQREQVIWPFFLPGVLAAFLKHHWPVVPRSWQRFAGFAAMPLAIVAITRTGYWMPANLLVASVLFNAVLFSEGRALRWAPLQTLGTISYSVYLLQYLVIYTSRQLSFLLPEMFREVPAQLALATWMMASLVIVSALTYRWIERPWMARAPLGPASSRAPRRRPPEPLSDTRQTEALATTTTGKSSYWPSGQSG